MGSLFWTQIGFGSLPVILVVYALIFGRDSGAGTRAGNPLIEYLTFADLLILVFATVWSYRYTRIARQLADPARRPSQQILQRAAWIAVAAGAVGIVFSMLVMLFEVANLGIRSRHDEFDGSDLRHVWRIDLPHLLAFGCYFVQRSLSLNPEVNNKLATRFTSSYFLTASKLALKQIQADPQWGI